MRILKEIIALAVISLIFLNSIELKAKDNYKSILKIKSELDSSYFSFDTKKLKNLQKEVVKLKSKSSHWSLDYFSGIIYLQLGKIVYNDNGDRAFQYFEKSLNYFLKVEKKKHDAETLALLSAVYGKLSSLSTFKAIYYGLKSRDFIYEASKLDSNNSKVLLIAATHLMHTPESFGGDKEWAKQLLRKAHEQLYKNPNQNKYKINWANDAEIYAYLAQLEILNENKPKAELYIDKALTLIPNYGFVLYDLKEQLKLIDN